jgi:general secretion pathway protein G
MTLIEILVVIVVLATLASLVAPSIFEHVGSAKEAAARSQIEMLSAALDAYRLDNGFYPTTAQGLNALRVQPQTAPQPRNWRGPYIRKSVPDDPWGRPYIFQSPGQVNATGFDLMTLGRDGQPGGVGEDKDLTNW